MSTGARRTNGAVVYRVGVGVRKYGVTVELARGTAGRRLSHPLRTGQHKQSKGADGEPDEAAEEGDRGEREEDGGQD